MLNVSAEAFKCCFCILSLTTRCREWMRSLRAAEASSAELVLLQRGWGAQSLEWSLTQTWTPPWWGVSGMSSREETSGRPLHQAVLFSAEHCFKQSCVLLQILRKCRHLVVKWHSCLVWVSPWTPLCLYAVHVTRPPSAGGEVPAAFPAVPGDAAGGFGSAQEGSAPRFREALAPQGARQDAAHLCQGHAWWDG